MKELKTTLVKKGTTIGANATVIYRNIIGRYAFIGARAIITKDVPDYVLVYGNPGKIQGWMCECGVKLNFQSTHTKCLTCKKEYGNSII